MDDHAAIKLRLAAGALAPLTVDELAVVLGCRPDTVKRAVAALRPLQPGRAKRYLYGEVIEAMRQVDERPSSLANQVRIPRVRL